MEKMPKLKRNQTEKSTLNPIKKRKKKKIEIENPDMTSEPAFSSNAEKAEDVDDEMIVKKCKKCGKELRSDSKSKLCESCKKGKIKKPKMFVK